MSGGGHAKIYGREKPIEVTAFRFENGRVLMRKRFVTALREALMTKAWTRPNSVITASA